MASQIPTFSYPNTITSTTNAPSYVYTTPSSTYFGVTTAASVWPSGSIYYSVGVHNSGTELILSIGPKSDVLYNFYGENDNAILCESDGKSKFIRFFSRFNVAIFDGVPVSLIELMNFLDGPRKPDISGCVTQSFQILSPADVMKLMGDVSSI